MTFKLGLCRRIRGCLEDESGIDQARQEGGQRFGSINTQDVTRNSKYFKILAVSSSGREKAGGR